MLSVAVAGNYCVPPAGILFSPLMSSVTFSYPLKTSENLRFSDVFRGYKKVTLDINRLMTPWVFLILSWLVYFESLLAFFPVKLIQYLCVISDSVNQIWRYTALSQPDFGKTQLNASTYMCCNLKVSIETATMIEIFQGPGIIYLVFNV